MILASAQTKPKRGDIRANLADHERMIDAAAQKGADLILFPEMSITGYERDHATELAFSTDDPRLDGLRKMAIEREIIVIAGAPIRMHDALYIGAFILKSDGSKTIYTKQFLHEGEEQFFAASFEYNPVIELAGERLSLAICADIDNPLHAANASDAKTTVYLASIFFSPQGIPNAHELLSGYAKKHGMHVLMSNFAGQSWGRDAGGKSAFWDKNGKLIAGLDGSDEGLVLVEKVGDGWESKLIHF